MGRPQKYEPQRRSCLSTRSSCHVSYDSAFLKSLVRCNYDDGDCSEVPVRLSRELISFLVFAPGCGQQLRQQLQVHHLQPVHGLQITGLETRD